MLDVLHGKSIEKSLRWGKKYDERFKLEILDDNVGDFFVDEEVDELGQIGLALNDF